MQKNCRCKNEIRKNQACFPLCGARQLVYSGACQECGVRLSRAAGRERRQGLRGVPVGVHVDSAKRASSSMC